MPEEAASRKELELVRREVESLEAEHQKMVATQNETVRLMDRVSTRMDQFDQRHREQNGHVSRLKDAVWSQEPGRPGILLRQDRLERQIANGIRFLRWLFSGGLLVMLTTIVLLYKIMQALEKTDLP